MTLKELAKKCYVSPSTASKALRYSKELNSQTIELVNRVAIESGYFIQRKKHRAQSQKNKLLRVAIICPEIISVYYSDLATKLSQLLSARGASTQIYVCNFDNTTERKIMLECLQSYEINGVINLSGTDIDLNCDFPHIKLSPGGDTHSVAADNAGGIYKAAEYLKKLGHIKIGFIGEKLTGLRQRFFTGALEQLGLTLFPEFIAVSPYRFEQAGYLAVTQLIKDKKNLPTAFIAAYDEIAFGAISALMENDISVPHDISVIGINNVPAAKYFPVPLTTVAAERDKFCAAIAESLFNLLSNKQGQKHILLDTKLIIRSSSGEVNKNFHGEN